MVRSSQALALGTFAVLALVATAACIRAQDAPPKTGPAAAQPGEPRKDPEGLVRLSPQYEIWLDTKNKRVLLGGYVCLRSGQLEMLVTLKGGKEHESVVAVNTKAQFVHAALLSLGAEAGEPVQFRPEYQPPKGTEVDVTFRWVDGQGKTQEVRGQDWVRYSRNQRAMELPFVFAGSGFEVDELTKSRKYQAEEGDLICVSNFPSATFDVPAPSSQGASDLLFEAFSERIPPVRTPVTVILTPRLRPENGRPGVPNIPSTVVPPLKK